MSIPVIAAPPASAETTILSPKDGAVITSGSQLTAKANADFYAAKVELRISGPGVGDKLLDEQRFASGELTGTFPITHNGAYKLYVDHELWNEVAASNFTVKVPPATPSGVSAAVSGEKLVVKWGMGKEADLEGYTLSGSGVKPAAGSVGTFCSGGACSASLPLTQDSGTFSVEVRAKRSDGAGGSVYSDAANASDVVAAANAPSGGGSTSLPAGGSSAPSASTALTPFNEQSPITLPSVQPDGATPGLVYPAPEIAGDAPVAQNVAATDRLQWGKSIGIALVLLVVAAHLGTWTRSLRVAGAATSSRGRAARIARGGTGRKRVTRMREHIARAEAVAKTGHVKPKTPKPDSAEPAGAKAAPAKAATRPGSAKAPAAKGATATMPARGGARRAPSRKGGDAAGRRRPAGVDVKVARSRRK
ncbi:hypothetical protein [Actinomadura sediminis]|uniref:Fibronectin type-III domain-containing protein n=1 Tax=Actinomadura sediminis TaxID=1038904 RepID=A0ABW3EIX8_9ACTN